MEWQAQQFTLPRVNNWHFAGEDDVTLSTDQDIVAFNEYMFGESTKSQITFLRSLTLCRRPSEGPIPFYIGQLLIALFGGLALKGRLRSLTVKHAETLLSSIPGLAVTVAQLTTLDVLSVNPCGAQCLELLRQLRSPLTHATINIARDFVKADGGLPLESLHDILLASRTSLQRLELGTWNIFWEPHTCFPNVTSLTLRWMLDPQTLDYVRAFPRLQVLRTHHCDVSWVADEHERRAMNQAAQSVSLFTLWTTLARFRGSPSTLFHLAIPVHIPFVSLDDDEDYDCTTWMLKTALCDVRPLFLELRLTGGAWLTSPALQQVFAEPALGTLQSLTLSVWADSNEEGLYLETALDTVVNEVIPCLPSLASFDLNISGNWSLISTGSTPVQRTTKKEDVDMKAIARRIQRACRTRTLGSVAVSLDCGGLTGIPRTELGNPYNPAYTSGADDDDIEGEDEDCEQVLDALVKARGDSDETDSSKDMGDDD
ncbi:hypothetical protein C8Q78DRAFT_991886 [Trametes maxima]|nr:hypothetical protein C8Q78DRAFT_991886 [Trametes maxima]